MRAVLSTARSAGNGISRNGVSRATMVLSRSNRARAVVQSCAMIRFFSMVASSPRRGGDGQEGVGQVARVPKTPGL
jgi:hypothetical protein